MEGKKISFSFMKTKKAEKPIVEEKKDFIECVEEKSIKVVGGEEVKEVAQLVIPMKPNTLITAERLKQIAVKVESALEEPDIVENLKLETENSVKNETIDQMAVRELLEDAKKEITVETPKLTVPLPSKPVNEGEKESTLDDYESVPVQDFGMAMLRGMGWAPNKQKSTYKQPQLRPKGLGLGADKVVKGNQKQKSSKHSKDEELSIIKNAFVKITSGKYSGYYGKVVSLDEDNGRVMVDIAVKKETVSLSEFMMHPVSKSEFDKESKVINAGSYEEYKKKETTQKSSKGYDNNSPEISNRDRNYKDEKYSVKESTSNKNTDSKYDREDKSSRYVERDSSKNGKDYKDNQEDRNERDHDRSYRRHRNDSVDERSNQKKSKKYSSNESLDSLSDSERKRPKKKERRRYSSQDSLSSLSDGDKKKKYKKKDRKRHDTSDSESDHKSKRNKTPEGKRDIDKKRKGKKKKRDRDRSPNYRKHRK